MRSMGSSFGQLFRITTWGESHGGGVGVVIDGCPPRIELSEADIQRELDRRRPGQSAIATPRDEADRCEILSGVFEGRTLGTPISIMVMNQDARPEAYAEMKSTYRPSHADFTYEAKYGIRNWQGGGRASARETIGRVAAGAIARKIMRTLNPAFELRDGKVGTTTNRSGGVQGGISNGENIFFRVAFKPTATIAREQKTVTAAGQETTLAARGRHDPCVLPRAVPIVEAMAALVLCDHALRQQAICGPPGGVASHKVHKGRNG